MNIDTIRAAIPHRNPMLLIDEIMTRTEDAIVCRKNFQKDEYFFQGHYPGKPIVPGVILCEVALQAGAVLLAGRVGTGGEDHFPVVTRMTNVKFRRLVEPGSVVEAHVRIEEIVASAFFLSAKLLLEGAIAARLDFACTVTDR